MILLYTQDVQRGAEDTKEWLEVEFNLPAEIIDIFPVSKEFSDDPVDSFMAAKEAYKGLEIAQAYLGEKDRFEFNASSGTPIMKTSWSVLQAAGYVPQSSIWQVRNPK